MKNRLLICLLMTTLCLTSLAQTRQVRGVVTSAADGWPLPGAIVQVQGSTRYATTDGEGRYSIKDVKESDVLVFSMLGFVTSSVAAGNQSVIDIALQVEKTLLEETVVIGYGTVKKSDLSGAVSQIKAEELMKGGAIDIAHGIQGKIAGVVVQQSDGAPGGGMSILVRGANSFTTSSQPLFIVDGIPLETGSTPANTALTSEQTSNPLSFLNPHDIESM